MSAEEFAPLDQPPISDKDRASRARIKARILEAMEKEPALVIELKTREVRLGTAFEQPEDNARCLELAHELANVRCVSQHPFPIE